MAALPRVAVVTTMAAASALPGAATEHPEAGDTLRGREADAGADDGALAEPGDPDTKLQLHRFCGGDVWPLCRYWCDWLQGCAGPVEKFTIRITAILKENWTTLL
jgi:hypothetical protein